LGEVVTPTNIIRTAMENKHGTHTATIIEALKTFKKEEIRTALTELQIKNPKLYFKYIKQVTNHKKRSVIASGFT
jgi:hypothetical protein